MEFVRKIEDSLAGVFKDLPPIRDAGKEGLVKIFPWIAGIFGILQLVAALGLWHLVHVVNVLNNYAANIYQASTGQRLGLSGMDKTIIYLGLIVLIVDAVVLLMAVSPLNKRLRRGWDLLFLSSLINLFYSVIEIFIDGRGFGSFILSLIGSALAFYLLYQVRGKYGKVTAAPAAAPQATDSKDTK